MSEGFRAYVARDYGDHLSENVRLFLVERYPARGDVHVLAADGRWVETVEGARNEAAGILFPAAAIEVIAQAIEEYQGHASHAGTEARVLREWLAVEMERVNNALEAR